MKSYTDLNQSKKLAEILPLESADMIWILANPDLPMIKAIAYEDSEKSEYYEVLPAWSLAALLGVLPKQIGRHTKTLYWFDDAWHCEYVDEDSEGKYGVTADNPVDACVEMIEGLHELKML